jgi:ABC-type glycerol-3-phosphate transport system permease component
MAVSTQPQPVAATSPAERRPAASYMGTVVRYVLLASFSLLAFAPFILSFLGTFKTSQEILAFPPTIFPEQWNFVNWERVWNFRIPSSPGALLPRWLFNSTWLAIVNVITQLFFCSLAAYAFARIRFPGRDVIFFAIIASMAVPAAVTLIPGYVFFANLPAFGFQGSNTWINTFLPLIIPKLVVPVGILTLTQFFKSIPRELEEAAYLDGLGRFGTYWNVALPLSRPALLTFAIIAFQGSWNDFVGPLLFLQNPNIMTLTVGMSFFRYQYTNDLTAILVGAMFNAIPMLILFFIFSRYYMESSSYSGLAGQ